MQKNFTELNKEQKTGNKKNWIKISVITLVCLGVLYIGYSIFDTSKGKIDLSDVSSEAVSGANLNIGILRMDVLQAEANVLKNLRNQREDMEKNLKSELERTQKALESEKKEIEAQQSVLSRDALAKKVNEYQEKVVSLQKKIAEKAQKIEMSYQKALANIQKDHLDPIVDEIVKKKNIDLIIDGRLTKISSSAASALDITPDVLNVINKKVSKVNM